jgi:hypothetical protein
MNGMLDARSAARRLGLAAAVFALAGAPAQARDCAAWPGEPNPLPRVGGGDSLLARWAALRAQELARHAKASEADAPVAAHRVWRHVLCLDPADEAARAGALRTRPLHVHRPEIRVGPVAAEERSDTDLWRSLGAPLAFAARAPAPPRAALEGEVLGRDAALAQIDGWLAAGEAQVTGARFEAALANAARARARLDALPQGRDLPRRRLRLELIEATAEAARGRDEAARACFARVLALEPGFAFDARTTSPKLMRLLDAARVEAGVAR